MEQQDSHSLFVKLPDDASTWKDSSTTSYKTTDLSLDPEIVLDLYANEFKLLVLVEKPTRK